MSANHAERAISDEGNAFIQCGMQSVSPYDNLTAQLFAPGDSPYARGGHHFSNGETWVEVLGKALGVTKSALPVRRNPHIAGGGGCIGGGDDSMLGQSASRLDRCCALRGSDAQA